MSKPRITINMVSGHNDKKKFRKPKSITTFEDMEAFFWEEFTSFFDSSAHEKTHKNDKKGRGHFLRVQFSCGYSKSSELMLHAADDAARGQLEDLLDKFLEDSGIKAAPDVSDDQRTQT